MSENSEKKQESGVMYIIPRWMVLVLMVVFTGLNGLLCGFIWGIAPEMRDRIIRLELRLEQEVLKMNETQLELLRAQLLQDPNFDIDQLRQDPNSEPIEQQQRKWEGDAKIFNLDGTPKEENN